MSRQYALLVASAQFSVSRQMFYHQRVNQLFQQSAVTIGQTGPNQPDNDRGYRKYRHHQQSNDMTLSYF